LRKKSANVSVLSFIQNNLDPAAAVTCTRYARALGRQVILAVDHAIEQLLDQLIIRNRIDLDAVRLLDVRFWRGHAVGPACVVAEQQHAFALLVEPADGSEIRQAAALEAMEYGFATTFIAAAGHHAARLVEHHIEILFALDQFAVDGDFVAFDVDATVRVVFDLAVHADAAAGDQRNRGAA
jgi:hypothetical protein